ncbi:YLP motif-containing protein 1 [Anthophora plagiata]
MQNWNQWQLSAGAVATPMPQPPVGYAAPGADPMAMMQAYMQYYNQPAPSGYTAEQWAAAQQQNWAQWQQWQQQYQQWQAQYGEKYQETMKHMSAQNINLATQVPQLPIVQPPPPLPKEDTKPPLPPTTINTYQFTSMPPPHQNNLPLFPVKQNTNATMQQTNVQNCPQNPPLPPSQPPLPPENSNSSKESNNLNGKRSSNTVSESNSAKKLKIEDEELTEAEKTFDAQFKQWEEQFNKWKQQNANHPDKTQYKQYEAKWTSWREKLIERREQMRRKREQQKQATVKAEVEKTKGLPGDDKIMNILSSTENQGLINNLLGIGKTLGLTGKQTANVPPPPPPPPATETTVTNVQTVSITSSSQATTQSSTSQMPVMNMMSSNAMTTSNWNTQQWASQYNAGVNVQNFPNFQHMTGVPPPPFSAPPTQMPPPNFTQPPPNFPAVPNFSQPPPGFVSNDSRQSHNVRPPMPLNVQGRPPPFGPNAGAGPDGNPMNNERSNKTGSMNNFDPSTSSTNFSMNDPARQKEGVPPERFSREGINEQQGNQFRTDLFGQRNENYKLNDERVPDTDQFRREERNNQFNQQKQNFNNDRFAPGNDRFGPGSNRFTPGNDRFAPGDNRFGPGNDRFVPGDNRFVPGNERFGPGGERIGQGNEPVNDRFGQNNDRFGPNNEPFAPGGDRFNRSNMDRFDQKDVADNRRDSFPNTSRGFNRNSQFEPSDKLAPELKKLMEKRRAALDVFKPSYLDSDKNSSSVGSLSESFKKITGESPFIKPGGNNNFGPRGPPNFSPGGSGNFRMPGDFKLQGAPEFGPRGPTGIGRNNSFDLGGAASFRGPNSSPQLQQDFINVESRPNLLNLGNEADMNKENKSESAAIVEQPAVTGPQSSEQNADDVQKDTSEDYLLQKSISMLEKPPWVDAQLPEDTTLQKDSTKGDENPSTNYSSTEQNPQNIINESTEGKQELSNNDNDGVNKKTEVLPFMGENDPKPEDLNMEPPPELPNLGPVSTDTNKPTDPTQRPDESYDSKESSMKPFTNNPECFDPRSAFDSTFGPKGMQFRPNVPFFGPRGPSDVRFPMFEPRGPNSFPFNASGPNLYPLGPRGPNDGQFGSRGPNNGQFGPRGPPGDGQFGPRGPNDGQFGPRGANDGQFGPRGPNDVQFGPRGPTDGQFGPRGPNDGIFGPGGPNDGPFGPRGPTDNQFGLRGPNNGQFGPRGSNIGQFGLRFDSQMGVRRPTDGQFGSRGPNDAQFAPQGPNNRPFGPTRPNEAPFDNRGPCEPQFIVRGPNDGQPRFSGPNDRLFGSRRNDPPYHRSPSGSKGSNDGHFSNRFNEKQLDNPTDFGSQSSNDSCFGLRAQIDRPFDNRQFDIRGIGEFRSKGSTDNAAPKIQGGSEPSDGGAFDNNEQIPVDKNMQQGQFDSNDMQNSGWRQPYSKNSFGDIDQRSGRDFSYADKPLRVQNEAFNQAQVNNIERRSPLDGNKSNISDNRSEKSMSDMTIGGYKAGYIESSSGSDYNKFGSPMFIKRSGDNRHSQIRCQTVKEFCIEKQFNYNHGGAGGDKKFTEHIPVKVIDYAHTSQTPNQDHLTPVQCFDYGHGNLKPLVSEHEVHPKKDFRNWEENEQNLKEYTEKIRRYEYYAGKTESKWSGDYKHRRDNEELMDNRKPEREYREREDHKVKDRDDRIFDHTSDKEQDNRYDKSTNKERTRERCETSQKEINKENDKDEERSKGTINWQENSNNNIIDTKLQETSVTDTQHNVLEPAQKTMELAKTPNCTMVDDLLCPPGRQNRPPKIAIILRGPPGSGKSFVAKLIKDKEVEQGGSAPRILSLDDYFLAEKEIESTDDNGKKVTVKEMVYEYEEAMEQSYITSLVKAFKKNITDGFFNFIILDCINEKISDYEEMWSFAKTKGFKVYVCEMEMDLQICIKRNIHNRTEDEINRIIDYFEPTPSYHQKLDVNSMLQEQAIEEVHMEDSEEPQDKSPQQNEDSQDSQDDTQDAIGVSKWERMEAEDKLDRLDGLAKMKNEGKVQTMKDFLQVPDYYNMEDTSGKKRVRWADLEERKEQEKMRAVGFVVGHTNWDRMMDPTKGGSALTRTKFFSLS